MNRKGSTGKLIKPWPILVDHYTAILAKFIFGHWVSFSDDGQLSLS